MRIRRFRKDDTCEVASLISRTYKEFNSSDYFDSKAAHDYIDLFNPQKTIEDKIYQIFNKATIFYVAEDDNNIVGAIRGAPDRISSLFVDGMQHRKGIGKRLLLEFEKEAARQGSKIISLRSQLYSVVFYEKMGYRKTRGIMNAKGLKVYPMRKFLN